MPKSTRATKFSDIRAEKPWLKKKGLSKYNPETVGPKNTILIVCEGETEADYFKSFPTAGVQLECIGLGCSNTRLVECALDIFKEDCYSQMWVVFDYDEKKDVEGQAQDFNNAIHLASSNSSDERPIRCAYSNDSFELWFVLHYLYTDQRNHRSFYYKKLSSLWDIKYEDEGKKYDFRVKIFDRLKNDSNASLEEAIKRARANHQNFAEYPFHEQNPVTTVYCLVEELLNFTK